MKKKVKKVKGNVICSIILRLSGRISSGEKGDGIFGEENQDLKKWVGRISSYRELYSPLHIV